MPMASAAPITITAMPRTRVVVGTAGFAAKGLEFIKLSCFKRVGQLFKTAIEQRVPMNVRGAESGLAAEHYRGQTDAEQC